MVSSFDALDDSEHLVHTSVGAESLPVPPETAYQPSQTRIRSDQTALNSVIIPEIPPPKYTAASEPVSTRF